MSNQPQLYSPSSGTLFVAHAVYALHLCSILLGVFRGATVVGAFIFSWPSIIAVILNYIFRSDAQETYVYSHFAWQIRTFWFAFLFVVLVLLIGGILLFLGIGLVIYWVGFFILGIWVAYRIIYGWMKLNNRVPLEL